MWISSYAMVAQEYRHSHRKSLTQHIALSYTRLAMPIAIAPSTIIYQDILYILRLIVQTPTVTPQTKPDTGAPTRPLR